MNSIDKSRARAVADLAKGYVLARVEIGAPPERVFRALASDEIVDWWVRPGVFRTTKWTGDVRVGGRLRASGEVNGQLFVLEGEFLEIDPPRKLLHTRHRVETPDAPTAVTYLLEPLSQGTRITLRHTGFTSPESCTATSVGWETSFERLADILATRRPPGDA